MKKTNILLALLTGVIGVLVGLGGFSVRTERGEYKQRKLVFQEVSPDGQKKIVLYEKPFLGGNEFDYRNYLANQNLFVVETFSDGREYQVFVNDYKTGYPHWLGNEHIFFTGGCGSGCQALYLVNVYSKESRQGLLTFTTLQQNRTRSTFFDWFGGTFTLQGAIQEIRSVFLDNQAYLIFRLENPDESPREQKFLVTKTQLKAL